MTDEDRDSLKHKETPSKPTTTKIATNKTITLHPHHHASNNTTTVQRTTNGDPMPIPQDLDLIARQESELHLPAFDPDTAWRLGNFLRDLAISRAQSIVIDIRRFGQPHQPLFYTALAGTTPDNSRWVQRKSNVVARFHRSSYAIGLTLAQSERTFSERYNLPDADYAAHGGSFPLHVEGAGIIGSVTVSGLPQREDHNLVVEALCLELKQNHDSLRLA
jgi:uncharacterized protein (UPF0303 family)